MTMEAAPLVHTNHRVRSAAFGFCFAVIGLYLWQRGGAGPVTLLTDGRELYARTNGGEIFNLLRAPTQPLLAAAAEAGIPIWGEVELAWRMRPREGAAPWLTVTGTNGKTTTVQMLTSILRAAGKRAISAGNVGTPILEAVMDPEPFDAIAVELSSFQLHWSSSIRPQPSGLWRDSTRRTSWRS